MKKSFNNMVKLQGYLYDASGIKERVTGENSKKPGTQYLNGVLKIATDDEGLNVVDVHYTYVTATTKAGRENRTYTELKKLMESPQNYLNVGKEAIKLEINSSIRLNEWYSNQPGHEGELVSTKQVQDGFINEITEFGKDRNTFVVDLVVTGFVRHEADEERGRAEYGTVKGIIFGYKNVAYPVEFNIQSEKGMDYFEELAEGKGEDTNFINAWGEIVSSVVKTAPKTIENAFGESLVIEGPTRTLRSWNLTGSAKNPLDFGGDDLTLEELKGLLQDREVHLAELKSRSEAAKANKASAAVNSTIANTISTDSFQF